MPTPIMPFLWFETQALEAARFYVSIFPRSKINGVAYYTDAGPGPAGSVLTVEFTLLGARFVALNGGPQYKFTPALSLYVPCKTQQEIDTYWKKLAGKGSGGEPVACGWLTDKYGVSWQIAPAGMLKLIGGKDKARTSRVMTAMFPMKKLDLAKLEAAAAGTGRRAPARKSVRNVRR